MKDTDAYMIVSVREAHGDHEAHNLFAGGLSETVRPWYEDVADERVSRAIEDLKEPGLRGRAAQFLGLEIFFRSRGAVA